jgi:opacity protein-like surface antigen
VKRFIIVLLLSALGVSVTQAQVGARFGIHGNAASINVAAPFSDVYGLGYGGGAHLDITFLLWSIRFSGDYIMFSPDEGKYRSTLANLTGGSAAAFSIEGGKIDIISGAVNAKFTVIPLPVVSPYITGGVGLARIGVGDLTVRQNGVVLGTLPSLSSETKTSVNLGAGIDFSLVIDLFLEAKYTWIFTEGETSTYIPVTLGITF